MPGARLPTAELLRSIINLLDRAFRRSASSSAAALVRIDRLPADPEDPAQFALRPIAPGIHPLAVLDGFVAPPTWAGIGIVACGRVQQMDDRSARGRGRVILVLARDGTLATGLVAPDGSLHVDVGPVGSGVTGELPLALCRALGVPCVVAADSGAIQGERG